MILVRYMFMLAAAGPAFSAPVQWAVNGHYYEYVSTTKPWAQARRAAWQLPKIGILSPHLATISSQGEQDFIFTQFAERAWIDGSDALKEGEWKWTTGPEKGKLFYIHPGQTVIFSAWAPGEPNNAGPDSNEDFLMTNFTGNNWNDLNGTTPPGLGYVVEWSDSWKAPIPEPSSWVVLIAGFALIGARLRSSRSTPSLSLQE